MVMLGTVFSIVLGTRVVSAADHSQLVWAAAHDLAPGATVLLARHARGKRSARAEWLETAQKWAGLSAEATAPASLHPAAVYPSLIGAFGLERFRHHRTSELSTGTRRIVELPVGASGRPCLLWQRSAGPMACA